MADAASDEIKANGNSDSNEMSEFIDSLSDLHLHDNALDDSQTADLVQRCLAQFDKVDAPMSVRSVALYTLNAQLHHENPAMTQHVPNIVKRITTDEILNDRAASDSEETFHHEVIMALSVILNTHPVAIVDENFPKILRYLIASVSSDRCDIQTAACEFWIRLPEPPVPQSVVKRWNTVLAGELPNLMHTMVGLMIYKQELAAYLEENASSCTDMTRHTLPPDLESVSSLRNYAALAFEHVCRACPIDAVCDVFRPFVEQWIDSDDWTRKEVAVLALAAFTEGVSVPDEMRDAYPIIVPRILDCYTHPRPLVRSIACFTMPKLLGYRLRGVKDPLPRVLSCTAKCMRDQCAEVRSMATRGLAAILAYVGGDIASHVPRLVDALVRAHSCTMDSETRCAHYECVTHLVCRVTSVLSPVDFEQLTSPMMDTWCSLKWNPTSKTSNDEWLDPDLGVVPLSHSLCAIANYAKSLFSPYAERIFDKACNDINDIILYVRTEGQDHGDVAIPIAVAAHLVASCDILSATYDGLGGKVAPFAAKNHVPSLLYNILTDEVFNEVVHQRAFVLLGHVIAHESDINDPPLNDFIDVIASKIDSQTAPEKLRGSALWALSSVARHPAVDTEKLFSLTDRLIAIFECVDGPPACIINAAWALTNICALHASQSLVVITRSDVFLHLCGLLQAPFPRALEKTSIFRNVCAMLSPAVSKIGVDQWPAFLSAVALSDETVAKDDELQATLRTLLRDIKATLGSANWSHVLQEIGSHMSSVLRRRFKLY